MRSGVVVAGCALLIAVLGNGLADVATFVAARFAGGARGCDVDLDAGGRFAVLFVILLVYPAAHIVLGGVAAGLSALARPAASYWAVLGGAWVLLAVVSIAAVFYPGC
ncbi:hypothetical protein ACFFTR_10345 [Dactylosporangium vinaceum]|uniref:Uncharacterized protein n=1 Tax=Dactylosporangium vinaceum TaxID=53362 RepID=A0ABV5M3R2_9ACTN